MGHLLFLREKYEQSLGGTYKPGSYPGPESFGSGYFTRRMVFAAICWSHGRIVLEE